MAEEEAFENLENLDWSDVESELFELFQLCPVDLLLSTSLLILLLFLAHHQR